MEIKEANKKLGFFKRLKKAIFELEDYGYFLGEKLGVAFKYFFILVLVVSAIFTFSIVYKLSDAFNTGYDYIVNELPEFAFTDGKLKFNENVNAYDEEYNFKLLINTTNEISEEDIKGYKDEIYKSSGNGLILLEKELILIMDNTENYSKYAELLERPQNLLSTEQDKEREEFSISNKAEFIEMVDEIGFTTILLAIYIVTFASVYLMNVIVLLSDVCVVAVFGWFASRICGVNFKMNPMLALAIYGLSLSILLDLILDVIYIMTGFTVEYFNVIYLLIAYVYIIAAIFMIKYDLIKHTEELQKIIEVQKQVKQDLEGQKVEELEEGNEEKEEAENKEDNNNNPIKTEEEKNEENRDPDGSEI